jgi:molybdate-binding protein/DNA-binding XRE family transcriptional regulator
MQTQTQLRQVREQRAVSAAQLARMAGVSRQTIYAIEAGDYVPNTALALQLARLLEVRVEDLFQLEAVPVVAPPVAVELLAPEPPRKGQAVQICRVGRHMVAVPAIPQPMLPMADGVLVDTGRRATAAKVQTLPAEGKASPRVLIAGCDPGMSLLVQHLARFQDVDCVLAQASSQLALDWLKQGKVHVAGTHLRDHPSGEFNLPLVRRLFPKGEVTVVTFAVWEQGLVVQPGNPKNIQSAADLARKDVSIVNREKGAGSRDLLEEKLREAGIALDHVRGHDRIAAGHLAAALAVSLEEADCCIATRSAARGFGLTFIPLATERYDLVLRRSELKTPAVDALLDVLNRSSIRRRLELLAGYDTTHTGQVLIH